MLQSIVYLGAAVEFLGGWAYLRDTLKGVTQPNRVTFFFWALAPLIATAAELADGVTFAAIPVFMAGFIPLLIFVASFVNKNAYWKLKIYDYVYGGIAALALVLWAITNEPLLAIMFAIISDGLATVPTLIKSWRFPESETGISYGASIFAALTGFFVVGAWNLSEYAFLIYLVLINSAIFFAIYRVKISRIFGLARAAKK